MATVDVGDKAAKAKNLLTVSVDPAQSESVVIKNVAGDDLSYYPNTINGSASTLTATNSVTVTQPTWIQSTGRTTVQLTGGKYGAV